METLDIEPLFEIKKDCTEEEKALIRKAFSVGSHAHRNQKRNSGDPYFIHCIETAKNLARFGMDTETIIAGLLHDTLEDTDYTAEEMKKDFGEEILFLVQGVTKLGALKYKGVERHAESLRKFFIASAHDIRVVVIKLADRLHNISTLAHVRPDKQKRIALETLEIHARLADRLGMGRLKAELEDKAFPFAYPEDYTKVKLLIDEKTQATEKHLSDVAKRLEEELGILDARVSKVDYRVKHLYSLWKKLQEHNFDIDKIYDILALRIIVPSVSDCYHALGIIHGLYKPLPGRFKDYIAVPKPNGYRSLHTAVFDGAGETVEIQIRTSDMHDEAEYGIASHLSYKEVGKNLDKKTLEKRVSWTKELLEAQKNIKNPEEFLSHLKLDFFEHRLFVYTPKGDVIELPEGGTPIDFAYRIHSDVGNSMSGVRINGKMASYDSPIKNGDIIEIQRSDKSHPTRKWLLMCKTTFAKHHIRKYLREHGGVLDKVLYREK
jgi:GTP pyrophosphokinase